MPEIPFRPFRVLSDPGSDGQRHARTGYLPDRETESEINFVHLSSIRTYARKTRKTDRHIRHQYDRRTIPELPADTLFHPVFDPGIYGITVDVYALIPFALVILTMGMESGYFRFAAKADEAGGDVTAAKRRLFATTWGITSLAALLFSGW